MFNLKQSIFKRNQIIAVVIIGLGKETHSTRIIGVLSKNKIDISRHHVRCKSYFDFNLNSLFRSSQLRYCFSASHC